MSAAISLPTIELDSQLQIIQRLQFLTRFSSNLVHITGPEGAGKSFLAQLYLSASHNADHQALLMCHAQQTDIQHRAILLKQLFKDSVFNEKDTLAQSVARLLGENNGNLLIVIDDAHLLSPSLLAELWALVQEANHHAGWQISVLLFALPERLDKYLSQVAHGQSDEAVCVEIPQLSSTEVQRFVGVMLSVFELEVHERRAIKTLAEATAPWPGSLAELVLPDSNDDNKKKPAGMSGKLLIFVALLTVGIGLIAWHLPKVLVPEPTIINVVKDDEPLPPPVTEKEDNLAVIETGKHEQPVTPEIDGLQMTDEGISEDTKAMPEMLSAEGLTVGRQDDRDRLIVPGELVDSMLDEQAQGGDGSDAMKVNPQVQQAVEDLVDDSAAVESQISDAFEDISLGQAENVVKPNVSEPLQPEAQIPDEREAIARGDDAQAAEVQVVNTPAVEEQIVPVAILEESQINNAALREVSSTQYALQLAAMRSLSSANQFIADVEMEGKASIYQTVRDSGDWFIVVTGEFRTARAARAAEAQMSAKVRAVEPWVKSYRLIHAELDRLN